MSTPSLSGAFRDPGRPVDERVADLLGRLTLREKIGLLHQYQAAVPRLGVGAFRTGTEALHGLAWLGPATVFPQAIGLASTWDPDLVREVGAATGDEVVAFHHKDPAGAGLNVWAPVVNPLRDPRWGRNEEGYSEDPWLTGVMGTAYARGLRGDHPTLKTAPTLKHFLGYNNESDRCSTSSGLPPRVLHEYELKAFRAPLQAGAAVSLMPSYNLVNGRPALLSPLIGDTLRAWAADGLFVVSDAYAPANLVTLQAYHADLPEAYASAIRAGLDSFTQDDNQPAATLGHIAEALRRGLLAEADVDTAAGRALALRFRLGEFDPATPYDHLTQEVVNSPEHQALARRAATESIVLLKNEGLLPLAAPVGVAVVGPLADTLMEDWYSGTLPYAVTARAGLAERCAVEFCEGVDRIALHTPGGYVTAAEHFAGAPLTVGQAAGPTATWFDLFDWGGGAYALRAVANGRYVTAGDDGVLVNDQPGPGGWEVRQTFRLDERPRGALALRHISTGRHVELSPDGVLRLADDPEAAAVLTLEPVSSGAQAAAELAARADVAIVVLGDHPLVNGRETEDRADLSLPGAQDALLRAVHAANPATVLVVSSGYPFALTWAQDNVPAVVWSAHGGQEYGHALADVLFGDQDPGGRLTQTWYRSARELPDLLDYDIIATDSTYQYYRGTPLYPFGHGGGYTDFAYSGLRLSAEEVGPDDVLEVRVTVTNTGRRPGVEVVQLYTRQRRSRVKQPLRRLRGFERIRLAPGESRTVMMAVDVAELAFWDVTRGRFVVEEASHTVLVGRSARDIRLCARLAVAGERIPPRDPYARPVRAADNDEYDGVLLCDADRTSGDAVRATEPGAWIVFREVDFAGGAASCSLAVTSTEGGVLTLRLGDPLGGEAVGAVSVAPGGDRYAFSQARCPLAGAAGVHDLYVVFESEGVTVRDLTFTAADAEGAG
ncbi:glycoside hydrolase family 3 C-terminal domain-containing protein [Sphaerisporangium sp. TRM90804]|uniref:glycoside hydrolase family 3 C-terminal domain-containing protein n=1 Tax=Sphaerisporangium sp. TRM90804 TaxID=3031113 RepID=UPI00244CD572|nr:glycoside hydrolase family 3 C-terminal domain-containing protein [Sphaerisporangium sp. TRM90804]MDH2428231.1 glycoside hydrolase family 3 C-terminal domain-containing protein [Sphaerisporangium sp. TRM90804]